MADWKGKRERDHAGMNASNPEVLGVLMKRRLARRWGQVVVGIVARVLCGQGVTASRKRLDCS